MISRGDQTTVDWNDVADTMAPADREAMERLIDAAEQSDDEGVRSAIASMSSDGFRAFAVAWRSWRP